MPRSQLAVGRGDVESGSRVFVEDCRGGAIGTDGVGAAKVEPPGKPLCTAGGGVGEDVGRPGNAVPAADGEGGLADVGKELEGAVDIDDELLEVQGLSRSTDGTLGFRFAFVVAQGFSALPAPKPNVPDEKEVEYPGVLACDESVADAGGGDSGLSGDDQVLISSLLFNSPPLASEPVPPARESLLKSLATPP